MRKWQAIVFDLDDTLYPEHEYVKSGFAAVAAWSAQQFGISADAGYCALLALFTAGVRGDTFNRWASNQGLPADAVPEMIAVYRAHAPQIKPFGFVPGLLQQLAAQARLGLVSDGYLAVQQRKFVALSLADYFSAVVFSDQWGRASWKPSPKPFQAVLEQLGVTGEAAVYIGDNPLKDFKGARQANMATVWVRYAHGDYSGLTPPSPEYGADFVVNNPGELAPWLMARESTEETRYFLVLPER
jgi:putative hydrolase of the HAD superfamily